MANLAGRYPLRFGMAAYAAWYGTEGPCQITDYRVDGDRPYPVKVSVKIGDGDPWATSREVGTAKAGGDPGNFWVDFETAERTPRFYSVWQVDQAGSCNFSKCAATSILNARVYPGGRRRFYV